MVYLSPVVVYFLSFASNSYLVAPATAFHSSVTDLSVAYISASGMLSGWDSFNVLTYPHPLYEPVPYSFLHAMEQLYVVSATNPVYVAEVTSPEYVFVVPLKLTIYPVAPSTLFQLSVTEVSEAEEFRFSGGLGGIVIEYSAEYGPVDPSFLPLILYLYVVPGVSEGTLQ